jgi:hypothetical protein
MDYLTYNDEDKFDNNDSETVIGSNNVSDAANKEVGLEVNPENTKYMLMSCSQKTRQRHSIKIENRSFEDAVKFKHLGTTLTDQN